MMGRPLYVYVILYIIRFWLSVHVAVMPLLGRAREDVCVCVCVYTLDTTHFGLSSFPLVMDRPP